MLNDSSLILTITVFKILIETCKPVYQKWDKVKTCIVLNWLC